MSKETIILINQLVLIFGLAVVILFAVYFTYRQQTKELLRMFKKGALVLLGDVMIWKNEKD